MQVQVTAHDIADGDPGSCATCPVALALDRHIGGRWRVDNGRAENQDGGRIALPDEVREFIRAFDAGNPVEPFAFEVPGAADKEGR